MLSLLSSPVWAANLVLLDNYEKAVCIDGSPGGFYFVPGDAGSSLLLLLLITPLLSFLFDLWRVCFSILVPESGSVMQVCSLLIIFFVTSTIKLSFSSLLSFSLSLVYEIAALAATLEASMMLVCFFLTISSVISTSFLPLTSSLVSLCLHYGVVTQVCSFSPSLPLSYC